MPQRATRGNAKPKMPATRKVATPKVKTRRETDQELIRRLDAAGYGDAEIGAAIRRGEHKAVPTGGSRRSARNPVQISSEQQMATHASQQSRAALSSPSQVGAQRASGRSGLSSGSGGRKVGSGPLVRGSNGSVNLRGGTGRDFWKRDPRGRFSG